LSADDATSRTIEAPRTSTSALTITQSLRTTITTSRTIVDDPKAYSQSDIQSVNAYIESVIHTYAL